MSFMKGLFNKLFGNNNSTTIIDTENTSFSLNYILAKSSTDEKMKNETEHEAMEQKSIQPNCKKLVTKLVMAFILRTRMDSEEKTVKKSYCTPL